MARIKNAHYIGHEIGAPERKHSWTGFVLLGSRSGKRGDGLMGSEDALTQHLAAGMFDEISAVAVQSMSPSQIGVSINLEARTAEFARFAVAGLTMQALLATELDLSTIALDAASLRSESPWSRVPILNPLPAIHGVLLQRTFLGLQEMAIAYHGGELRADDSQATNQEIAQDLPFAVAMGVGSQ